MSFKSMLTYGTLTIENVTISDIIVAIMDDFKSDMRLLSKVQHYIVPSQSRRGVKSGVVLKKEKEGMVINLYICLFSYKSILSLCERVQARVTREIEWLTGITVNKVNVYVEKMLLKQAQPLWTENVGLYVD
ncbi:Asp23/Gls24 family envelope stress response protein [Priestia taiwanensis]|uniref:Asp23/Gls24 family envelope stress response protein n=1 Tax=Priestia taiwanensis TaxID=1347902 RepID=A0A917AQ98_9BACI|nr:Asp23/Gls24 family envelope stress response protein [Priestia taiwanensis]MBM7362965.1 putative alkaline shock family protein YloU [Priestia taiwanensis]GGE66526.1 hypothetical protein GCM10007140_15890 [Priestia taiwanensis]